MTGTTEVVWRLTSSAAKGPRCWQTSRMCGGPTGVSAIVFTAFSQSESMGTHPGRGYVSVCDPSELSQCGGVPWLCRRGVNLELPRNRSASLNIMRLQNQCEVTIQTCSNTTTYFFSVCFDSEGGARDVFNWVSRRLWFAGRLHVHPLCKWFRIHLHSYTHSEASGAEISSFLGGKIFVRVTPT